MLDEVTTYTASVSADEKSLLSKSGTEKISAEHDDRLLEEQFFGTKAQESSGVEGSEVRRTVSLNSSIFYSS